MKIRLFRIRVSAEHVSQDQKELDVFLASHEILKYESAFVAAEEPFWSVILYHEESQNCIQDRLPEQYPAEEAALSEDELKIMDCLRIWRSEKAKVQKIPSYCIASNKELLSVARRRPARKEDLREIKGFGKHKIENYGSEIIEILDSI